MHIGKNAPQIYQYSVKAYLGEIADLDEKRDENQFSVFEMGKIMDREQRRIEMMIGKYIYSGYNLWTTQKLDTTYSLQAKFMGKKIAVIIDQASEYTVNTADIDNQSRSDCQAMNQVINVIVKQAMSETGMLQFGKRPRFFDSTTPIFCEELKMQIWSGFKASAYHYSTGNTLIIDNCSRFMSTKTVLDRIDELYDEVVDQDAGNQSNQVKGFQQRCRQEFANKSIIANYGNKRTYIIQDINFELGPCNTFFDMSDGQKVSIAKYFLKQYGLKITVKKQPMIMVKHQGRDISIPSEFCLLDGVPDSIRSDPRAMRTLLGKVKQNPKQKIDSIQRMLEKLFSMSKWAEWDIKIDREAQKLESRRLAAPQIVHSKFGNQEVFANERNLKTVPVFSCENLEKTTILIFHERFSANEAQNTLKNCQGCLSQMDLRARSFELCEVPDIRNIGEYERAVLSHIKYYKDNKKEFFALFILNKQHEYVKVKQFISRHNVLSQVVQKFTARKMNLSVASNIMKQINSKIGGTSLKMVMPDFMTKNKVMVIGIDVCHAGGESIVGFTATTDDLYTQYYSNIILQQKGQEVVEKKLDVCMREALDSFQKRNGSLPDRILIYRDGVGEGMRDDILNKEVAQFKTVMKESYNKMNLPTTTLVVVNKRINQRMFMVTEKGEHIDNPPPGSIIDSVLVENDDSNVCFDFFMVPQKTTQGCVTPTHFFCSLNESKDLSKSDLETITYNFCYLYSNWSGSIKVPAPCQYAHKIAEYHHTFDAAQMIKRKSVNFEKLGFNQAFQDNLYYL